MDARYVRAGFNAKDSAAVMRRVSFESACQEQSECLSMSAPAAWRASAIGGSAGCRAYGRTLKASLVVETGIAWKALSLAVRIAASRWAGLIPLGARPYASRRECARAESDRSGCRSMRAR